MKKSKKLFCIPVLTVVLILLCAFLPRIIGYAQDTQAINRVGYSQSAQVQLDIQQDMTPLGKLSLLCRMEGVLEVPEEFAQMTAAEAEQAALDALRPYVEGGLIPEFTVWYIEARPFLILTPEEVDLAGLVWSVTVLEDEEGVMNMSIDIDDATGTLLRLHYTYEFWEKRDQNEALDQFAEIYFRGLGVEEHQKYATNDLESWYIGDNVEGIRYRVADRIYGEVNLDLFVSPYGFYVDTPKEKNAVAPA